MNTNILRTLMLALAFCIHYEFALARRQTKFRIAFSSNGIAKLIIYFVGTNKMDAVRETRYFEDSAIRSRCSVSARSTDIHVPSMKQALHDAYVQRVCTKWHLTPRKWVSLTTALDSFIKTTGRNRVAHFYETDTHVFNPVSCLSA